MQVAVESLSGLARKLTITVPDEEISQKVKERIKDLAKKVELKGFRPGKTPESIVRMHYGPIVREEVIRDVMQETLQKALQEKKLIPAGEPKFELTHQKEGDPLEYIASFEVYPEVPSIDLSGIEITRIAAEITEADVDKIIQSLREQNTKWQEVSRDSQNHDQLVIDFQGTLEGETFKGGSANDFQLVLGKNTMIPGFEEPLIGSKAGETKEIEVTFPKDYHVSELAGKPAVFKVKVYKVLEPHLPELDDAFAKDLGVSNGTIEGLRQEVRTNMQRDLNHRIRDDMKSQIVDKILALNQIDVPQAFVDAEIQRLQKNFQKQFEAQTGQKNIPELPASQFEQQARRNVTIGLLLSQWIQENDIKVDAAKVRKHIEEIAAGYHHPQEIVNLYYSNKEALAEIEASVLEEQTIDLMSTRLKIIDKPTTYQELIAAKAER